MPMYVYGCYECNYEIERIAKADEDFYPMCPCCYQVMQKKVVPVTFRVNGYNEKNGYSKKEEENE